MSEAGTRSSQGDEYQIRVATHWVIRLLEDESLEYVQAEVVSIPDDDKSVDVDDIVVSYVDGRKVFIQAKKNETKHQTWKLTDTVLQKELRSVRDQLEKTDNSTTIFYSRSPFGDLKKVCEECRTIFTEYGHYLTNAPGTVKKPLKKIAEIIDRSEEVTHQLVKHIEFGSTREYEEWDYENRQMLDRSVTNQQSALEAIEGLIRNNQTGLRGAKLTITREDIVQAFHERNLVVAPKYDEAIIIAEFNRASNIGRNIQRTIAGEKIERPEKAALIDHIQNGQKAILVTDQPGSGKTCLLIDLAEHIEKSSPWKLLFIKGDWFSGAKSEEDLAVKGLPVDIVGKCARLAAQRKIVVILDSLDVLALNREHGTLQLFLSLVDQLERVPNVTIIAACRTFDMDYDPLLRERQWSIKLPIRPLGFEEIVCPLLNKWGVSVDGISEGLKSVLGNPQSLRLFSAIAGKVEATTILSEYHIQDAFIAEVIEKDETLGPEALDALQKMAAYFLENRKQSIPIVMFNADENVVRRLISQEVLFKEGVNLHLSHQTLLDALVVRGALSEGKSFSDFILSYPPFPFIRPFVRAFFFCLRTYSPDEFNRQVWNVLVNDKIAYHLKRLIAESLAEIVPVEDDWPLIRRLFNDETDLFQRFWWRIKTENWLSFMSSHWLPIISSHENRSNWRLQFLDKLKLWMDSFPEEVISFWREALKDSSDVDTLRLARSLAFALNDFNQWETPGIRELLDELSLVLDGEERNFLGKGISRYVEATGQGDDLLWHHIVRRVDADDVACYNIDRKLSYSPHNFIEKEFLSKRLVNSENLLNLCLKSLSIWSEKYAGKWRTKGFRDLYLSSSSWKRRHGSHDINHLDDLNYLLNDVEKALKEHSKRNSSWWRDNEPRLRLVQEEVFVYFLIESYLENIADNIVGVECILNNPKILRISRLKYELGQLTQKTFPYISSEAQELNQKLILGLFDDDALPEDEAVYRYGHICDLLSWVPKPYHLLETQAFLNKWQRRFGDERPEPEIYSWGGTVRSPISAEQLLSLSDKGILGLLRHYIGYDRRSDRDLTGGQSEVSGVFSHCCTLDPIRFMQLVTSLASMDGDLCYLNDLLRGVANHLDYRFGYLQTPKDWKVVEPLPEGEPLAKALIETVERYPEIQKEGHVATNLLKVCSHIVTDEEWVDRLCFALLVQSCQSDPEKDEQRFISANKEGMDEEDIASTGLSSVRGMAAEAAAILASQLIEKGKKLPEILITLLRRFSRDPVAGVRHSILRHLPYLTSKEYDLGWEVFEKIFREPQKHLWRSGEKILYYHYDSSFERVKPYLDRIASEVPEIAGQTLGRITTLACLSGHVSYQDLIDSLQDINTEAYWKGAAQVFSANLDKREHFNMCEQGLLKMFETDGAEHALVSIESISGEDRIKPYITERLALALIESFQGNSEKRELYHFLNWFPFVADKDPMSAMCLMEAFADKVESLENPPQFWHSEPLITTLVAILREADETDDIDMISRSVKLQDRFLKMDIHNLENVFDQLM